MNEEEPMLEDDPTPETNAAPLRLMLVEGEPMNRMGWRRCLESAPSFSLCCEAESVETAHACWVQFQPEIVILDPDLDGGGGWKLLREMAHSRTPTRCLVCLGGHQPAAITAALQGGAQAVALRRDSPGELLDALVMAAVWLPYLSPSAARTLAEGLSMHGFWGSSQMPVLPERQGQIFRLLGQGRTPGQIASTLGVSTKTVQTHVSRLKIRLNLNTQAELCHRAILAVQSEAA